MVFLLSVRRSPSPRKIVLASVKSKLYLDGPFVWLVGRGGLRPIGVIGACLAQGCQSSADVP